MKCDCIDRIERELRTKYEDGLVELSDQEIIALAAANGFDSDHHGDIVSGWQDGADITPCVLAFARALIAAEKSK